MDKKDETGGAPEAPRTNEVNNGEGKPYYTQRDNAIKPESSCNVTSMIAGLSAAGYPLERFAPAGGQPEDALMRFIMTDPATLNRWKQIDPRGEIPPNEWHPVLAFGTNRFLQTMGIDSPPVTFFEAASREEIIAAIDAGGAAVISGYFPRDGKTSMHHVVAVTGYGTDAGNFYFIIDDPWGDYRTGYKSYNGKNIRLPAAAFGALIKPQGAAKKWAHIIRSFKR